MKHLNKSSLSKAVKFDKTNRFNTILWMACFLLVGMYAHGQYSTFYFNSASPADGPSAHASYCYSSTSLPYTYCQGTDMPAYFAAGTPPSFKAFNAAQTLSDAAVVNWGNKFLTYSLGLTGAITITFDPNYKADFGGLTVYNVDDFDRDFTINAYDVEGGNLIATKTQTVAVGQAVPITIDNASPVGFVKVTPSAPAGFGINNILLAEPLLCSMPSTPTISATSSAITIGGSTTLSISVGSLNDATSWKWYSGSCGGTLVGTGTSVDVSPTQTTTYFARGEGGCVVNAVCGTKTITVNPLTMTWTGATSNDVNNPSNWSPAMVPSGCMNNVYIPSVSRMPSFEATMNIRDLKLGNSVAITLNANVNVCGDLIGGGSTTSSINGNGLIVLSGNRTQQISGKTSINYLRLDNASGAVLLAGANVDIKKSLELKNGEFVASTGTITLKSTSASNLAIIDNFSAGYSGTFTGTITAERVFAASGTYDQHLMGSPVNRPSLSQFGASESGFVVPTNDCDETKLTMKSPYGTVFTYHEEMGTTCALAGWKAESSGTAENGLGYSVLQKGAGKITLTGSPNLNSSYSVNNLTNTGWMNFTKQGNAMSSGWHLLANPYPATMNITESNAGFDNQIQIWHSDGPYQGSYQAGTIGSNVVVAPFQGFMVHKTDVGGTADFTIHGSDRVTTAQRFYKEDKENTIELVVENATQTLLDKTTVGYNLDATDGFDPAFDANKLSGTPDRQLIYSVSDTQWMSVNMLKSIQESPEVPVHFYAGTDGQFNLLFNGVSSFDPTVLIMLEDKKQHLFHNIRSGNYAFYSSVSDDRDRFVLHFTPAAIILSVPATCTNSGKLVAEQQGEADWDFTITGSNNNNICTGRFNQNSAINTSLAKGVYTLTLRNDYNYVVLKTFTIEGADTLIASFNLSSENLNTGETLELTSESNNATAHNWSFGDGTDDVGTTTSHTYNEEGIYTITYTATNASGCESTVQKTVTVTKSVASGIQEKKTSSKDILIWGHENEVIVDFTKTPSVKATITIFNILGQEVVSVRHEQNNVFRLPVNNVSGGYAIVKVMNQNETTIARVYLK